MDYFIIVGTGHWLLINNIEGIVSESSIGK